MAITVDTTSIPGTKIVYDSVNGGIAIDYTTQFNNISSALSTLSNSTRILSEDSSSESALEIIARNIEQIKSINNEVKNVLTSDAIPIKDIYSAVSYASLIKVLEEDGVDIDALIAKTQARLNKL
jgi:hypothetical protein